MIASLFRALLQTEEAESFPEPCYRLAQLLALQALEKNAHRIVLGHPKDQPKQISQEVEDSGSILSEVSQLSKDDRDCERCGVLHFEGSSLLPVWFQVEKTWVKSSTLPFRLVPDVAQMFRLHGTDLIPDNKNPSLHIHVTVTEDFFYAVNFETSSP